MRAYDGMHIPRGGLQMAERALTGETGRATDEGTIGPPSIDRDSDCVPEVDDAQLPAGARRRDHVHDHAMISVRLPRWARGTPVRSTTMPRPTSSATRCSPSSSVQAALHAVVGAAPGHYLDVDDGQAAHAACELIALGLGYANASGLHADVRTLAMQLRPSESFRVLALAAIARITDVETSEVAGLLARRRRRRVGGRDRTIRN